MRWSGKSSSFPPPASRPRARRSAPQRARAREVRPRPRAGTPARPRPAPRQGIGKAVFVDYSGAACRTIAENLESCGFGDRAVVRGDIDNKYLTLPTYRLSVIDATVGYHGGGAA